MPTCRRTSAAVYLQHCCLRTLPLHTPHCLYIPYHYLPHQHYTALHCAPSPPHAARDTRTPHYPHTCCRLPTSCPLHTRAHYRLLHCAARCLRAPLRAACHPGDTEHASAREHRALPPLRLCSRLSSSAHNASDAVTGMTGRISKDEGRWWDRAGCRENNISLIKTELANAKQRWHASAPRAYHINIAGRRRQQ